MRIHPIIDYYIEYENNERFMQSSLIGKKGKDYPKEILSNPGQDDGRTTSKKGEKFLFKT